MCDFSWLSPSPADQGDLSDVVRASLGLQQPPPHHRLPTVATPAPTACSHGSLGAHGLPEEDKELLLLLLQGDHDHDEVQCQQQQQLVQHGDCNGGSSFDDHAAMLQSSPSHRPQPQPHPHPEGLGLIRQIMSMHPPPQLGATSMAIEGGDVAAPPEMEEHGGFDMALAPHPHAPAIKRRKSQTKKVVCIPAPTAAPPGMGGRASTSGGEVVPSDLWAWRKYGQKPIKGSPFPRGYYRCSSSKGCSARKQVERSRTDPSMLVITYTSDHNHPWPTQRNALAGSTRPASSSSAKSHHHHQHRSAAPTHANNVVVNNNVTPSSIHQHQLPKQEVLEHPKAEQDVAAADHDLDMFADTDGASNFHSKKQQQHATAADVDDHLEKLPEEDDNPFSFSFFDWVGASFGIGEAANKGGYT